MNFIVRDLDNPAYQVFRELIQDSINSIPEMIDSLEKEISKLKESLKEKEEELAKVEGEDYLSQQKRERLTKEIEELREELEQLEKELEELERAKVLMKEVQLPASPDELLAPKEVREENYQKLKERLENGLADLRKLRDSLAIPEEDFASLFKGIIKTVTGLEEGLFTEEDTVNLLSEAVEKLEEALSQLEEMLENYQATDQLYLLLTSQSIQELESLSIMLMIRDKLSELIELLTSFLNGELTTRDFKERFSKLSKEVTDTSRELLSALDMWLKYLENPEEKAKYQKFKDL